MLKIEFEKLIGKEVDIEVFEMYNKMYLAVENLTKEQFVAMLDKTVIPKSKWALEAEFDRQRMVKALNEKISEKKQSILELSRYAQEWEPEETDDAEMVAFKKYTQNKYISEIKKLRQEIKELQFVLR